jgi:hypothetical protein
MDLERASRPRPAFLPIIGFALQSNSEIPIIANNNCSADPPIRSPEMLMAGLIDWIITEQKRAILAFLGGALVSGAAGAWTVYAFSTTRYDNQKSAEITRRIDAQKPFLTERLRLSSRLPRLRDCS